MLTDILKAIGSIWLLICAGLHVVVIRLVVQRILAERHSLDEWHGGPVGAPSAQNAAIFDPVVVEVNLPERIGAVEVLRLLSSAPYRFQVYNKTAPALHQTDSQNHDLSDQLLARK